MACILLLWSSAVRVQKNTSHGNEVLPQDTTHLIQTLCYQRVNPCQIQHEIRSHEHRLTIVKRRKLQWYGHVSHSSGLAKTIMQGTVKGGRRQGRQRKQWEDNIREWTGLEFAKSKRAVENREKYRKLAVKSSVVLQRPSRLRDRWWWWWWFRNRSPNFGEELSSLHAICRFNGELQFHSAKTA